MVKCVNLFVFAFCLIKIVFNVSTAKIMLLENVDYRDITKFYVLLTSTLAAGVSME